MASSSSASSSRVTASSSSAGGRFSWKQMDLRPLIVLGTAAAAKELAARQLLDAAVDGDIPRAKKWARRLQGSGKGVEAAAAAIADPMNNRYGCLHLAAAIGDCNMCKVLIEGYQLDVNSTDANGETPLMFAINGMQSISVMRLLLDSGADPNKADIGKITPLHVAVEHDAYEATELLLSKGVFVDPICEKGVAPLHIAARSGNARMLKLLLAHHGNCEKPARVLYTPLSVALFGSSLECLKLLVESGADVNAGRPVSPLTVAAAKGLTDCIKFLLESGADANIPDEKGKMPIEIAAFEGYTECVMVLFPVTNSLSTYAEWSVNAIIQHAKTERLYKGSELRSQGDAAFQEKDYALASTYKSLEPSMGSDEQKEHHEKLMGHCHSVISCLFALVFPVMIAMFAAETPLSDADKAMMLIIFVSMGATALIGLIISTSLAERYWAPLASAITLCISLFSLGLFQFAVGLFFPKFEVQIMSLDSHVAYTYANILFFLMTASAIILIWGNIFRTPKFIVLFRE